jgi:hypothetical protein
VFSKNRDRLLEGDIARRFFDEILEQAAAARLTSDEHFSVDGILIEAWASQKSFQRKDGADAMRPMSPRPIRMRGWHARVAGMNQSWRIAATC